MSKTRKSKRKNRAPDLEAQLQANLSTQSLAQNDGPANSGELSSILVTQDLTCHKLTGDNLQPGVTPDDTTKPTGDTTQPTDDTTQPTGDTTQPTGDPTQPTGDPTQPTGDTTRRTPSKVPPRLIGDFDHSANGLWNLHVKEAQRYDEARIHSLKGDMNGVLIFVRVHISVVILYS
jgi:hypothetical protein